MSNIVTNETSQTSSIGAAWPPEPAPCERLRGIYTDGILDSQSDFEEFAEVYHTLAEEMNAGRAYTRLSVRCLAQTAGLRVLTELGVQTEAAIPLADEPDIVLSYVGANLPRRIMAPDRLRRHGALLNDVVGSRMQNPAGHTELLARAGYEIKILGGTSDRAEVATLLPKFLNMYRIFGYDEQDVKTLLESDANTVVYLEHEDRIVSTAMAEQATVPIIGFGDLRLTEITEASTLPAYRQRGLYKAVSGVLTQRLVERQASDPVHAVYGESNLAMPGVLIAAHENGRRFSHFDRQRFGITHPAFGILPQNFRVEDGQEDRPYNDFAVSYVPLGKGVR
ncbi:MAG: hypothetical protein JWM37_494 [Candidatus Saccharibacteria bacterium]|nr:hypothetical protein [Candidatus Saccharibacteria bacterium]